MACKGAITQISTVLSGARKCAVLLLLKSLKYLRDVFDLQILANQVIDYYVCKVKGTFMF